MVSKHMVKPTNEIRATKVYDWDGLFQFWKSFDYAYETDWYPGATDALNL